MEWISYHSEIQVYHASVVDEENGGSSAQDSKKNGRRAVLGERQLQLHPRSGGREMIGDHVGGLFPGWISW